MECLIENSPIILVTLKNWVNWLRLHSHCTKINFRIIMEVYTESVARIMQTPVPLKKDNLSTKDKVEVCLIVYHEWKHCATHRSTLLTSSLEFHSLLLQVLSKGEGIPWHIGTGRRS